MDIPEGYNCGHSAHASSKTYEQLTGSPISAGLNWSGMHAHYCTRAIATAIDDGAQPHRMRVDNDERQRQHAGANLAGLY